LRSARTTAAYAAEYSRLSVSAPYLIELSIDDFVSQYRALFGSIQPDAVVAEVIANTKSVNHNLKFGATIYKDDLTSPYLQNADLPAAVCAQFDYVHLFIHYREDGANYPAYVQKAKQLFPHARIVAGSYAYDRRAFLPCAPKGQPCTAPDIELFKQSLTIQAQEMKHGIVGHIEFYPGYFGTEETWPSCAGRCRLVHRQHQGDARSRLEHPGRAGGSAQLGPTVARRNAARGPVWPIGGHGFGQPPHDRFRRDLVDQRFQRHLDPHQCRRTARAAGLDSGGHRRRAARGVLLDGHVRTRDQPDDALRWRLRDRCLGFDER
jgi:hypothetical protein